MSRGGIQAFQKERLVQALAARRLTQLQLSALAGVSPSTISKWKSGQQAPERDALDQLASKVNVTPEWFTRPVSPKVRMALFRSNASAHVAARAMLEARLEWVQDIALALGEFVDYPQLCLPERNFKQLEQITAEEIESAASECREVLRLGRGPIQDLALAAEGAGVILVREETGIAQIEGLSAWSEALGLPFVMLSSDKDNGYRSRFDLAHEIGHLILHRHIERPTDHESYNELERQAHRFAGALLLPAETFAAEVRVPVTLEDLLVLKGRWGVSAAAMLMRLNALGIVDDTAKQLLFKRRSARWGAKAEPGDNDRQPERPRLLRRSIELLVDEHIMPLETIPRHLGLSARDIETLCGLPDGYFEAQAKVVPFARLREPTASRASAASDMGAAVLPFRPPGADKP